MKQQLFEYFFLYYNIASKGWNYISPVSFVFPTGIGNVGSYFPACRSILCWNSLLKNSDYPVIKLSTTH